MRLLLFSVTMATLMALLPIESLATMRVAVIDTGIDSTLPTLCKDGHTSFTGSNPLEDQVGHGTHIAGLIEQNAGNVDYCLVALQFFNPSTNSHTGLAGMIAALKWVNSHDIKFINISAGGSNYDSYEYTEILKALDNGVTIVAAAGNEAMDLDKVCNYYPACYDSRIITVGNLYSSQDFAKSFFTHEFHQLAEFLLGMGAFHTARNPSSNYGKYVKRWEVGTDLLSTFPGGCKGYLTGTSQATAVATGKILKERLSKIKPGRWIR